MYTTYSNIRSIYLRHDDLKRADEYLNAAYENLKRIAHIVPDDINAKVGVLDAAINLGISFMQKADFSKAKALFFEALEMAEFLNIKPKIASILNNLGNISEKENDFGPALNYYKKG